MRSLCLALVVAVALGVAGVGVQADTAEPAPGSPTADAVQPGGQGGTTRSDERGKKSRCELGPTTARLRTT
jgi:hypothetical protein